MSYNQGNYTLTVTDQGALIGQTEERDTPVGLARITDASDVVLPAHDTQVAADYTGTYPAGATYEGEGPIASVKAYDALGNCTVKGLAFSAPTVANNKAYYKGTTAIVKATDQGGSKLWKVIDNVNSTQVGTFAGVADSEIATCTIPQNVDVSTYRLYVVDNAGNVSDAITLEQESIINHKTLP